MARIRAKIGRAVDVDGTIRRVGSVTAKAIAEEIVDRVQRRVDHPAVDTFVVKGINQHSALITGLRGGPGIILPVRKKALRFVGSDGGLYIRRSVRGAGFGPMMRAEARRIKLLNINETVL